MRAKGNVEFDESAAPVMQIRYTGIPTHDDWLAHIDQLAEWAHRGERYAILANAKKVGLVSATYRRELAEWIDRDRNLLISNCAGAALMFSNPLQRGLWTAVVWITPPPIPVEIIRDRTQALEWLKGLLAERA